MLSIIVIDDLLLFGHRANNVINIILYIGYK